MIDIDNERKEIEAKTSELANSFLDPNMQEGWNVYLTDSVECAMKGNYEGLERHLVWILGNLSEYMANAAECIGRVRRLTGSWK